MATYFVDKPKPGVDTNDGLDNIGLAWVAGDDVTWEESSLTFTDSAGGLTFSAGDLLYISGGTGATVGLYEVTGATDTTITIAATSTLPGVTDGNDFAAGDLGAGADITSSDGPWLTIDKAMNTMTGPPHKVWIRGGSNYNETASVDTAAAITTPNVFEGYTTTIGDAGMITIDGQSTRDFGIDAVVADSGWYVFKNIIVTGCNSHAFSLDDFYTCKNCEAHTNAGIGFLADNDFNAEKCYSHDNTGGSPGFQADNTAWFVACRSSDNVGATAEGFSLNSGVCAFCVASGNTGTHFLGRSDNCTFINCTVDGEAASVTGVDFSTAITKALLMNCIIYDCATGVAADRDIGELAVSLHNLLNSNATADYSNWATFTGEILGSAPGFTDEATGDYTLTSGSAAKATGIDAGELQA